MKPGLPNLDAIFLILDLIEIDAFNFGRRWGWQRRGRGWHGRGRRRTGVAGQGRTSLVVVRKLDAILFFGVLLCGSGGRSGAALVLVFRNRLPAAVALQADIVLITR